MKKIPFLFLIFLINSCFLGNSKEKQKINSEGFLISARVLVWSDLDSTLKNLIGTDNFLLQDRMTETKPRPIDEEKAFYVKLILNNRIIAKASCSDTLEENKALADLQGIYGKYRNSFEFFNSDSKAIRTTKKFGGFDIINIGRRDSFDTLHIGPIIEKPVVGRINATNSSILSKELVFKID